MTNNPHKTPKGIEAQTRAKPFSLRKLLGRVMLVALAIVVVNSVINANQNFSNRFKEGFYFEKYGDAEEARAALLELHSIGTDIAALRSTLEKSGAHSLFKDKMYYEYHQNTDSFLYQYRWRVRIEIDDTVIKSIYVRKKNKRMTI